AAHHVPAGAAAVGRDRLQLDLDPGAGRGVRGPRRHELRRREAGRLVVTGPAVTGRRRGHGEPGEGDVEHRTHSGAPPQVTHRMVYVLAPSEVEPGAVARGGRGDGPAV